MKIFDFWKGERMPKQRFLEGKGKGGIRGDTNAKGECGQKKVLKGFY